MCRIDAAPILQLGLEAKARTREMNAGNSERNIVLIGMPGVGKSTVGVLLAKTLSMGFVDTDVYIQSREGRRLQEIIDTDGIAAFRAIEERDVLSLDCRRHVVATGGSVVYSEPAMRHLKRHGLIIHLTLPLDELMRRLTNLDSRGVVMEPGQTVASLFEERHPLYARHADATIDCRGLTHEQVVSEVARSI